MKLLNSLPVAIVGSMALAVTTFAAPAPLWVFGMNNTGDNYGTTGSTSNLVAVGTGGAYSADALGVSGLAGDYAYVLGTANGLGSSNGSLTVGSGAAGSGISTTSLTSITLTGWFKTSVNPGTTRLFDSIANDGANTGGFNITLTGNTINFSLSQGGSPGTITFPTAGYTTSNAWTFFAVTYDASLSTDNVNFYTGTTANSVTLIGTLTLAGNILVAPNTAAATIGNRSPDLARHLNATVDDYRLFGSASDSTGVLSLSDLEGIRVLDTLNAVPEPSTYGLFVVALLGMAIAVRRRRGLV